MAQYIRLSPKEIQQIAANYGLNVAHTQPISGGHNNTNLLFHAKQGKFVLTIFDNKTKEEVEIIGKLLQHLKKHKIFTTRLRLTGDGRLMHKIAGKPILVKEFIVGQVIDQFNDVMLYQAGAAMAQLHSIPSPSFLPQENSYGFQLFPDVIGQNIDQAYESWLTGRYSYFQQHMPTDLPRCIIHADLFTDNILFENRQLKALIDFEDGCHYFRAFDIGMALVGLCRRVGEESLSLNKGRAFMRGYLETIKLTEVEIGMIQFFADYAATVTSYWRFWKYRVYQSIVENADKHWQMAKLADSISAVPASRFIAHLFG